MPLMLSNGSLSAYNLTLARLEPCGCYSDFFIENYFKVQISNDVIDFLYNKLCSSCVFRFVNGWLSPDRMLGQWILEWIRSKLQEENIVSNVKTSKDTKSLFQRFHQQIFDAVGSQINTHTRNLTVTSFPCFLFHSGRQLQLLSFQDFGDVEIEEVAVENGLDAAGHDGDDVVKA